MSKLDDLAFEMINDAVLPIQKLFGVTAGDYAGQFFSGDTVLDIFKEYIIGELSNKYNDLQFWFDNSPETAGHKADYPQWIELNKIRDTFFDLTGYSIDN